MTDQTETKHSFWNTPDDLRHAVAENLYAQFREIIIDHPGLVELKTNDTPSILTVFLMLADSAIAAIEYDHTITDPEISSEFGEAGT